MLSRATRRLVAARPAVTTKVLQRVRIMANSELSSNIVQTSSMATVTMRGMGAPVSAASVGNRVESDTMGKIDVPNDVYWGAQTQRSLQNFKIGGPAARMPIEIIRGK